MFSVDQLNHFQTTNPNYKLIKPWWDVLISYLAGALLAIAVLAGAMQATQSNLVCLPAVDCNLSLNQSLNASEMDNFCRGDKINKYTTSTNAPRGMTTVLLKLQDRRQYDYVETECSYRFHSFSLNFPIIIFLLAVSLIVVHNFWLKIPQTTSVIDRFISLVLECHDTPVLNSVVWDTSKSRVIERKGNTSKLSQDRGEETIEELPLVVRVGITDDTTKTSGGLIQSSSTSGTLDISIANKTKTLCEKANHFRKDVEIEYNIYWIYFAQAIFQLFLSVAILAVNIYFCVELKSNIICKIDDVITEDYSYFKCTYGIVPYYRYVHIISIVLAGAYSILCFYVFLWTCKKRVYNFVSQNIPAAKGNLAFLLHLLNMYNKLYSLRFSELLSERNEKSLKFHLLMSEWSLEKLNSIVEHNGRSLKLSNLIGIPKSVFKMTDLEELRLENCNVRDDLDRDDWAKLHLRSLSLVRCGLSEIPPLILEMDSLETLDLSYNNIESIPPEILKLTSLCALDVANNNIQNGAEHIFSLNTLVKLNLRGNNSLELHLEDTQPIYQMRLEISDKMMKQMDETTRFRLSEISESSEQDMLVIKYSPERDHSSQENTRGLNNSGVYKMASKPKGVAVIINTSTHSTRWRSGKDLSRLRKVFEEIGYRVEVVVPATAVRTAQLLSSKLCTVFGDCSQFDSVILMMISSQNGEKGLYLGPIGNTIEQIPVRGIVQIMSDIPSLKGKPKVIILQTRLHESETKTTFSVPIVVTYPDTFIAYFEFHGLGSLRDMDADSSFVSTLVDVFSNYAWREDINTLLTRVDYKLSESDYEYVSSPRNGLEKKFYFFPGYFGGDDQNNQQLQQNDVQPLTSQETI